MINAVNFCPVCGHPLDAGSQFCSICRKWTGAPELMIPGTQREVGKRLFRAAAARIHAYRVELSIMAIALLVIVMLVLGISGLL